MKKLPILPIVKTLSEIRVNIKTVANNLNPSVEETKQESYKGLVKGGTCFVVDKIHGKTVFAPSKFSGYTKNNSCTYDKGRQRHYSNFHGRITNNAIEKVTGLKWMTKEDSGYKKLEKEYKSFCVGLGFIANPKGRFGKPRKYIDIRRGAR